jgi:hypothetical protein
MDTVVHGLTSFQQVENLWLQFENRLEDPVLATGAEHLPPLPNENAFCHCGNGRDEFIAGVRRAIY